MSSAVIEKFTAVILAAGYGTRLQRDVFEDDSGQFESIKGVAKPLLPVCGKPLIDFWIEEVSNVQHMACDLVVVVVNAFHHDQFLSWRRRHVNNHVPVIFAVDELSIDNDSRSGAISCMNLAAARVPRGDHVLFIGGDTLFDKTFSLDDFLAKAKFRISKQQMSVQVTAVPCAAEVVHKHGIIETDSIEERVIDFKEKPFLSDTESRVQCPCFYLMSADCVPLIEHYLSHHTSLPERDATGLLIRFLLSHVAVFYYPVQKRYDIGSLSSYIACCRELQKPLLPVDQNAEQTQS